MTEIDQGVRDVRIRDPSTVRAGECLEVWDRDVLCDRGRVEEFVPAQRIPETGEPLRLARQVGPAG